jgi:hypothetical protein
VADPLKQLEDLIGVVPNPAVDQDALLALRDADPAARRLAERLHAKDAWRGRPLRDLLPGLAIIDISSFHYRLGARAANQLLRAGVDSWFVLASLAPVEILAIPRIGTQALEEILLAACGEWAAAYLRAAGRGSNATQVERPGSLVGRTRLKQILELIGQAPDPEVDHELLAALRDPGDADSRWFAEMLHTASEFKYLSLRQLLPGLGLVESPIFSVRLSVRAANSLGRINASTLSALAGVTPASILALPDVGAKAGEEILAAVVSEWAASYLDQGKQGQPEAHRGDGATVLRQDAGGHWRDLPAAFARIERVVAFEAFRRRQLASDSPTQAETARELGLEPVQVANYERKLRQLLAKQMDDEQSPLSVAASDLRSHLGVLARPRDLADVLAALDPLEMALSENMPHRRALLLRVASFRLSAEWVVDVEIEGIIEALLRGLTESGPAELDALDRQLARLGVREELRLSWIVGQPGFQVVEGDLVRLDTN